jgi:hypothetical protein
LLRTLGKKTGINEKALRNRQATQGFQTLGAEEGTPCGGAPRFSSFNGKTHPSETEA